ncbi:MAG: hypothetical protein U9P10_09780 [Thermodesulfobacteriota bacterium]|nr:hypothetical protein [Thermodesulfobacteriota bacterium]
MNRKDIISRFFHEKNIFAHDQIDSTFEIDYINDFTIVAVVGELGFEKIIGVSEYLRNPVVNFSFQGMAGRRTCLSFTEQTGRSSKEERDQGSDCLYVPSKQRNDSSL